MSSLQQAFSRIRLAFPQKFSVDHFVSFRGLAPMFPLISYASACIIVYEDDQLIYWIGAVFGLNALSVLHHIVQLNI